MTALAAIFATGIVAATIAIVLTLRGPAFAWWLNPAALAILAGTVMALAAILAPRRWWGAPRKRM